LTHTQAFTDTLAQRSGDIITIVSEGNNLLAELDARRQAIRDLLVNVTRVANELQGVVRDNEAEIGPALDQLNAVISMLKKDDEAIAASIHGLNLYAGSLGEIAHGAPYFMATVQNIAAPTNLIPGLPLGGQAGQPASPPSTGNGPGLPLLGGAGTGVGGPTR
jgi:phospholipid/cholesterol/gamma-HCH transport system substrate-binding protein